MGSLTDEIVIDILTGLMQCSVPNFVKLFDILFRQAKAKALDNGAYEDSTLEQVRIILSKAVDAS